MAMASATVLREVSFSALLWPVATLDLRDLGFYACQPYFELQCNLFPLASLLDHHWAPS